MNELTKELWIEEAYRCLCKSQGDPSSDKEEKNMRGWAELIYDNSLEAEDWDHSKIQPPKEAVDEELSYA